MFTKECFVWLVNEHNLVFINQSTLPWKPELLTLRLVCGEFKLESSAVRCDKYIGV